MVQKYPLTTVAPPFAAGIGEIVGVVLVFRDITERKQNEEELRQSHARSVRLAAIIDSADDAIVSKRPEWNRQQLERRSK